MRITRRIAAPALALLVSIGASGCAGLAVSKGCGMHVYDPMSDGASRMNGAAPRHTAIGQMQAYQAKAMSAGTRFNGGMRKPGQVAVQQPAAGFCF